MLKRKMVKTLTLITSLFIFISCNTNVTPEAELPVITSISSDLTTTVNKAVTLSVEASVTDEGVLSFQWYSATKEKLKEGVPIDDETSGSNTETFTPDVSIAGTYYYYCIITNTLLQDSKSIISPRIAVNVNERITIEKQEIISMPKNSSGEIGDTFNFEVATSSQEGVTKQYQWYFSKTENGEFKEINDAIKNEYSGKISTSNIGFYYCIITYTLKYNNEETLTESLTTNVVQLSNNKINANYPTIIIQPEDVTAVIPQTKTFTVNAISSDAENYKGVLSYQWYKLSEGETEGIIVEGATSNTLNITADSSNINKTTNYYCIITNSIADNGDGGVKVKSISSQTAKFTVNVVNAKEPMINSNPVDIKAIIPAEGTFTIGATSTDGGILTYQWYKTDTTTNRDTIIEGATNKTLNLSITKAGTTSYYCIITNTITDNGDGGTKTASIKSATASFETVYLKDVVSAYIIKKAPATMNIANPDVSLTFEVEMPAYVVKYQWYECSDGTTNTATAITPTAENGADSTTLNVNYSTPGIHYYYCSAKIVIYNGNATNNTIELELVKSEIVSVAYTGLPILYLDTGNIATSEITQDSYFLGSFKIVSEQYGTFEYEFKKTDKTTGKAKEGIKGRGNTSWSMPKKGYNIKFDSKKSILGMPEDKKWCIIANYNDKTLLRNKLTSYLGNEILDTAWNPSFAFVDVIMNGEYLGNYIFCEKNTIAENRINIQDISDCTQKKIDSGKFLDKNGDGIVNLYDGGFVLEVDQQSRVKDGDYFFRAAKCGFCLKDPDEVDDEIKEHVKTVIQAAENVLYGENFTDSEDGWTKYMDINSFVDWYIVNELAKNNDAVFFSSVYLYYDPSDNKLHLGPNWDFDIAYGNVNYNNCDNPNGFYIKNSPWISRMFQDPVFVTKVKNRWNEKRTELQEIFTTNGTIQTLADLISVSAEYNFKKWPILGTNVWPNPAGYADRTTYQSEVDYMKTWLSNRYNWLDTAINEL